MGAGALVLDVCAVQRLLASPYRPVTPRVIVPKQALFNSRGERRFVGYDTGGWAPPRTELADTLGVGEVREAHALRSSGLSACQAAAIVIARREHAGLVTLKSDHGVIARLAPFLERDLHDVGELWEILAAQ